MSSSGTFNDTAPTPLPTLLPSLAQSAASGPDWVDLTNKFTFASSIISAISAGAVFLFMSICPSPRDQANITRKALLFSLFTADFTNAFLASIAEYYYVRNELRPNTYLCTLQGFLGQWSIQASDLSTFALAVTTYVITKAALNNDIFNVRIRMFDANIIYILGIIWTIPCITATIGYFTVGYGIAGGWCWFNKDPVPLATYVRYITSHGPRMLIMVLIFFIYIDIFRRFWMDIKTQEKGIGQLTPGGKSLEADGTTHSAASASANTNQRDSVDATKRAIERNEWDMESMRAWLEAQKHAIQKLLVYPLIYFGLWIPGIISRFLEATNWDKNTIKIVAFFMFTIQLIGFANSMMYGFSRLFSNSL
ncbi:hypothetical protein HDU97_007011 [Phlyctochytrium planicorne]|nr:hypothetical protein HDU97_007011 [Phlyctochytrium planicorne]